MKQTLLSLSIIAALSACGSSDDEAQNIAPVAPTFSALVKVDPNCEPVEIPASEEGGTPTVQQCQLGWAPVAEGAPFMGVTTKQDTNPSGMYRVQDANPGESLFYSLDTSQTPLNEMTAPVVNSKYGQFFFSTGGEWNYYLWTGKSDSDEPEHDDVTNLVSAESAPLTDEFIITTVDGTQKTFVVTIKGIDEDSKFSGTINSFLSIDGPEIKSKTTSLEDANPAESDYDTLIMADGTVVDLAALAGTDTEGSVETEYGTLTFKVTHYVSAIKMDPNVEDSKHKNAVKAKFTWGYKLDTERENVKKFYADSTTEGSLYYTGEPAEIPAIEETFTLTSKGKTGNSQEVVITIAGALAEPAVVTGLPGVTEGEGEGAFTNAEKKVTINDGLVSGSLNVSDVNLNQGAFQPLDNASEGLMYGSITLDAEGAWVYSVDFTKDEVKALKYNTDEAMPAALVETVMVTTVDGTTAQFDITIEPSEQVAPAITGLPVVEIVEGQAQSTALVNKNVREATGTLLITDGNAWEAGFMPIDAAAVTHGVFTIAADGNWSYSLNEGIEVSDPETIYIDVESVDGTAIQLPVTIAPLAKGNLAVSVDNGVEAAKLLMTLPETPIVKGKISFKVNIPENSARDAKVLIHGNKVKTTEQNRTLLALAFRADGNIAMYNGTTGTGKFNLDQKHVKGEWTSVEFTWDSTLASNTAPKVRPTVSLSINGMPATGGTIPDPEVTTFFDAYINAAAIGLVVDGPYYFELITGGKSGTSGKIYLDDLVVSDDTGAEKFRLDLVSDDDNSYEEGDLTGDFLSGLEKGVSIKGIAHPDDDK
ncbi:VCBS domain-containing protein [Algibacillus agarilyticus]|uniref:VCBS domain-containing protein n=1 Tax=Algibacillus agarilyticus TaxID=2234133 RepID=UPI000DD09FFA|nr:VCBS domain-containing protein [Algibacillus agarilyticus]